MSIVTMKFFKKVVTIDITTKKLYNDIMKISSRFTIAVHAMMCIHSFSGANKVTSEFISASACVNPVIIRRVLGQLKEAGIIDIARGSGGATIIKRYEDITLYDIFAAVDSLDKEGLFGFHENPNPACPVGQNVHRVLDGYLHDAQSALEADLSKTTFKDIAVGLSAISG